MNNALTFILRDSNFLMVDISAGQSSAQGDVRPSVAVQIFGFGQFAKSRKLGVRV